MAKGILYIVSAPSGAGKTTLVKGLLEVDKQVHLSISYTTRAPREGEIDGVAYHFINSAQFDAMRDRGEFLEWAHVHDNYYATSAVWLAEQLAQGNDVLLEIDWQGARQVRSRFPESVGIFIMPPSLQSLEERLHGRGKDAEEVIQRRLSAARDELEKVDEFDYVIINKELPEALADLQTVVRAARLRTHHVRARNPGVFSLAR